MPSWLRDLGVAPEALRAFLGQLLPEARLTAGPSEEPYEPLLLVEAKHVVAAFGFANGDLRESYDALYAGFKSYYASHQDQLGTVDLAFVFCVNPGAPQLDQFCSGVETDVYFCRKFVVPLEPPLAQALARLPFLPLAPLRGRPLRPPSAQTFLQQCGVPAILAKFVVVQHERSPEGIVEDCASGEFGPPGPIAVASSPGVGRTDLSGGVVRLASVEIKNFRAYRKRETFTLGSQVTVLYGPNGFGKTSFFDAIDFAVTGGIGRLESRRKRDFAKTARHLDSGSEESVVSVSFRRNGATSKLTRNVNSPSQAALDGRICDRKVVLAALTRGSIPATDRVENFVSLFRASHLFSQEQQELTKDFQDDCEISAQIVSRMLAFEDYANALTKTHRVRDVLQNLLGSSSEGIEELAEEVRSGRRELERVRKIAGGASSRGTLDEEIRALRDRVSAAGVTVGKGTPDGGMVRAWRAGVEGRQLEGRKVADRLAGIAPELADLPRKRTQQTALLSQLEEKEAALKLVGGKRSAAEEALRQLEERLVESAAQAREIQVEADAFRWIRGAQREYAELSDKESAQAAELESASERLSVAGTAEGRVTGELRAAEAAASEAGVVLESQRREVARLEAALDAIRIGRASQARLGAFIESQQEERRVLERLRVEEREMSVREAAMGAEERRLSQRVVEVDRGQSELKALVSQLQRHIESGTCPLCGEDHGSREGLLRRIQAHVEVDSATGIRAELAGLNERSRQLADEISVNRERQREGGARLAFSTEERRRLEAETARLVEVTQALGIPIAGEAEDPEERVRVRLDAIRLAMTSTSEQSRGLESAVERARTGLATAKRRVAVASEEVATGKEVLSRLQGDKNRLRDDPRTTRVPIDVDAVRLSELIRNNGERLAAARITAVRIESEAGERRPQLTALQQEAATLRGQISVLRGELANIQRGVSQLRTRLIEARLPEGTSEESLQAVIAEQAHVQAGLAALADEVASAEVAIDAATTAAALASLLQSVQDKEALLARVTEERDRHQPWLNYFEELSRMVSVQQNAAIAAFVEEYGPRTSVIQRRLRSVYGFDDIEVKSKGSSISVRVKRQGEVLRPTDYFSQSQQQALLLGLFLSAAASQTWSAFSPVLLDDPVTHFDDLNTYAFLDLIVGLLEGEPRQFIISTCDEKLLQLARQKFRHLEDGARFYHFTALGSDGPKVRAI